MMAFLAIREEQKEEHERIDVQQDDKGTGHQ